MSVYSARGDEGEGDTELTPAVQQLCRHADAFVLVVDACHMTEEGKALTFSLSSSEYVGF